MTNIGTTWRHKKRGTTYEIIGEGIMNVADDVLTFKKSPLDGQPVVIYRGRNGAIYVRCFHEFMDGRFERLEQPAPLANPAAASKDYEPANDPPKWLVDACDSSHKELRKRADLVAEHYVSGQTDETTMDRHS